MQQFCQSETIKSSIIASTAALNSFPRGTPRRSLVAQKSSTRERCAYSLLLHAMFISKEIDFGLMFPFFYLAHCFLLNTFKLLV